MPANDDPPGGMAVLAVPVLTALVPLVAAHVALGLGVQGGHYAWCVPYGPDCVSISATARFPPGSVVFRAAIIATAILMLAYWTLSHAWLKGLGTPAPRLNRAMLWLGIAAALGLFAYAVVLGELGDHFRRQRRIGMMVFYGATILAQVLLSAQAVRVRRAGRRAPSAGSIGALVAVAGAACLLGVLSLLSWAFWDDYRRLEDAFEWWVTVLLVAHPLAAGCAWWETGFRARFSVGPGRP